MREKNVAILGATGLVGQKIIHMLTKDGAFNVKELIASPAKIGKTYREATNWHISSPCPEHISALRIVSPDNIQSPYILSALPADQALFLESKLAERGHHIFSNASANRMKKNVPLMLHDINPDTLVATTRQTTPGKIITNPNCVVAILSIALAPLLHLGSVKELNMVTLQSASGAGYPGVAAMSLLDNTIPNILEEEEKIDAEIRKIFPTLASPIHVQVNRIPIRDGHTILLTLAYQSAISIESIKDTLRKAPACVLHTHPLRPQPQDLEENDMRVHIGRIRQNPATPNCAQLVVVGHNLARGAAGATLHNLKEFVRRYG